MNEVIKVVGPMRQKDGREVVETQFVLVPEHLVRPPPERFGVDLEHAQAADPVPRLPKFAETHDRDFHKDQALEDRHEEDARLRQLSPSEFRDEIARMVDEKLAALEARIANGNAAGATAVAARPKTK